MLDYPTPSLPESVTFYSNLILQADQLQPADIFQSEDYRRKERLLLLLQFDTWRIKSFPVSFFQT